MIFLQPHQLGPFTGLTGDALHELACLLARQAAREIEQSDAGAERRSVDVQGNRR